MAGLLGEIYSYGNTLKRKVNGLLADPAGTAQQFVGQLGDDTNAQINNMLVGYGMFGNKSVLADPKQVATARNALADYGAQTGMAAATVWHGSPHKFDKFDSSKIGTGEGAQAYGHGLYLAESPDVAKMYQEKLTDPAFKYAAQNEAKARLNEKIAKRVEKTDPKRAAALRQQVESLSDPSGALYKVDLPDEHIAKMLDWDKPLSQQSDAVKAAIGLDKNPNASIKDMTGLEFYVGTGGKLGNPTSSSKEAAAHLAKKGIPGIRYLDGGSRGAGQGSSNFVVFPGNEGMLQILERNGEPMNKLRGLLGQ